MLAGALGEQPNGCHVARIDCASVLGPSGDLRAVLTHEQPGAGCSCTPRISYPVAASKIERPTGVVRILYEPQVVPCP